MSQVAGKVEDGWGPGTYVDEEFIPVPEDAARVLKYFASKTPGFTQNAARLEKVVYQGPALPIIPGPLKSQVMSAVIRGMIGIVASEISALCGVETGTVNINTDHAGLYPASAGLVTVGGRDSKQLAKEHVDSTTGIDLDGGNLAGVPMRFRTYAIYPTSDPAAWFQVYGSLDPAGLLKTLGLDENAASTWDESYEIIKSFTLRRSARDLELHCMENGLCGSKCFTPAGWRQTRMGQDLARHPLFSYRRVPLTEDLSPVPFPMSNDQGPLAGIKVVSMARIIAAPCLSSILASLGAEVIHLQSPHLHELQSLNLTLTAGKRTTGLDLNDPKDREHVEALIADADVVVQAYRLRSLERRGFGLEHVLEIAKKRGKGIVYVDLNCYGPDGYYAEQPGFQQIADAASGCSYVCGQAYGPAGVNNTTVPVLPSLPISDMETGAVGVVDVLLALRDRAIHGGSYHATAALVAVNTAQLEREVGLYTHVVSAKIQETYQFGAIGPQAMAVPEVLDIVIDAWRQASNPPERDEFYQTFEDTPFGKDHRILAPVVKFENQAASPVWKTGPVPYCWESYPRFT